MVTYLIKILQETRIASHKPSTEDELNDEGNHNIRNGRTNKLKSEKLSNHENKSLIKDDSPKSKWQAVRPLINTKNIQMGLDVASVICPQVRAINMAQKAARAAMLVRKMHDQKKVAD